MHNRRSSSSHPTSSAATAVAAPPKTATNLTRLLAVIGVLFLSLALIAIPAQRAFSHDYLMHSSPEDGAALDAHPKQIVLGFSGDIQDLGAQVVMVDESTNVVAEGAPAVDGKNISFDVPPELGNGVFTMNWRVVSSDSHPIEGTLSYTVAGLPEEVAPTPEETPAPAESPTAEPTAEPTTEPTTETSTSPATEPGADAPADSSIPWTWIIVAGAAGLIIGIILMLLPKSKKQQDGSSPEDK